MARHTPGPWYAVATINGYQLQTAPDYKADADSLLHNYTANNDANAELAAAAPLMLKALQDTRDFLDRANFSYSWDTDEAFKQMAKIDFAIKSGTTTPPKEEQQ